MTLADLINHETVAALVTAFGAVIVAVIYVSVGRLRSENRSQHTDVHQLVESVRDEVMRNQGKLEQFHDDNERAHERIIEMIEDKHRE